jgi:N-acetylmuramoyl-L-alanine amidase
VHDWRNREEQGGNFIMRCLKICAIFMLLVVQAEAWSGQVQNLRVWAGPESTRAVLDLDGRVDYKLFTLDNPPRVVVDISDASVETAFSLNPEYSGVIRNARHGVRNGGDVRVVFDLDDKARPQSFMLEPAGNYGHRLVIDLYPEVTGSPQERVRKAVSEAASGERDMIVAIDAGHGGEDPGAIGPGGSFEKEITLALARELAELIDAQPGMQAVLVRTGDYYIPLAERYSRARRAQADLFLSIHADAFRDFRVRGSSVYVLSRSGASSEAARWLAQSENQADLVGGVKLDRGDDVLSSVLLDLSQSAALEYSNNAAESILDNLGTVGRRHRDRVERANFVVLRSPDVPSVLIEVGFISNPQDEQKLNTAAHRRQVARAITDGVDRHFRQTAPQGTWFANNRKPSRYVVQRGDSLGQIAQKYQVSVNRLRQVNDLNGDVIHPGAVLVIPTGS